MIGQLEELAQGRLPDSQEYHLQPNSGAQGEYAGVLMVNSRLPFRAAAIRTGIFALIPARRPTGQTLQAQVMGWYGSSDRSFRRGRERSMLPT